MRDEMVAWLDESAVSVAAQAITKAMRLAQVCSGFLGGLTDPDIDPMSDPDDRPVLPPREIGREKLELMLEWIKDRLVDDPNVKLLIWSRFRAELDRFVRETNEHFPHVHMGEIRGSQKREAREAAIQLLDPRTTPSGPVIVGGIPKSGGMGLNLVASHDAVYMSNDYNLMTRKQSEDRIHRSGQVRACSYFDIVATGPKGQKTVDHLILKALRDKDNLATWTTSAWVHALTEE
jgi:hypothetical protein